MNNMNPFKSLPNVREFIIEVQDLDPLFEEEGIKKRLAPILKFKRHNNARLNRYILWQVYRLNKSIYETKKFWHISEYVLKRSTTFALHSLNHCYGKWHREASLSWVRNLLRNFQQVRTSNMSKIDLKRVYIQKANGQPRPLGVPSLPWRMYLHLWNQVLSIYLQHDINKSQHGFMPGKGTMTAWMEILEKVITKDNIYEYDLSGCFDRISISRLDSLLEKRKTPTKYRTLIENLNRNAPRLPEKLEMPEPQAKAKHTFAKMLEPVPKLQAATLAKAKEEGWDKAYHSIGKSLNRLLKKIGPMTPGETRKWIDEGLPQGCPTSPLLTSFVLSKSYLSTLPTVMYADDGIIYDPPSTFDPKKINSKRDGIYLNEEKSGWVKKEGKWLKPLKFLGLVFENNELRSETRKGASLKFDKW